MPFERLIEPGPVCMGIAQALDRAIPLPKTDAEAKAERQLLHRADLKQRVQS